MQISEDVSSLISLALEEDIAGGDITSEATIPVDSELKAVIIAREELIVCGQDVAAAVFHRLDSSVSYHEKVDDGSRVFENDVIAEIVGTGRVVLAGERTALNFMQRLSGISTQASWLKSLVANERVLLRDTRKTTPGWRSLEKYAVKVGGGTNHRIGLYDAFLIKNNHVDAVGGDVAEAIRRCRALNLKGVKLQVEVRDEAELRQALSEKPDSVLLDNMNSAELARLVSLVRDELSNSTVELEASGGVNEGSIAGIAQSGVDAISVGMLTHSVKAADISLRYVEL